MTLPRERRREGGRKKQTETEKTERQKRKKSPLGLEGPPTFIAEVEEGEVAPEPGTEQTGGRAEDWERAWQGRVG